MTSKISRNQFLKGGLLLTGAVVLGATNKGLTAMADPNNIPLIQDAGVVKMYALGEAGEAHRILAPMIGDWNVTMRMFPAPGETVTSIGMKSRKQSILDGRQIMEEIHDGTMAGVPHRKITMLGFNAVNARYEFVTADNLDTQQMVYHGARDPVSGSIVMTANYTQAAYAEVVAGDGLSRASGNKTSHRAIVGLEMIVRDVLTLHSNDHHTLQMFFKSAANAESLGAEYDYTRA